MLRHPAAETFTLWPVKTSTIFAHLTIFTARHYIMHSAVPTLVRCPSVRLSDTLVYCIEHRLRIRILWILKVPKIHEFLRILKLSVLKFIKFKLSHSSPPSSNKFFVANTALHFWIKRSVMSTVQDSLSGQQFSIIFYESPAASLSSPVSESQSSIITAHCSHSTVASV